MSIAVESTAAGTSRSRSRKSSEPKASTPEAAERNSSSQESSPQSSDSAPPEPRKVYLVRKRMRVNGKWLKPGEEVPEAHDWPRVESMVRAGFLTEEWR